MERPCRKSRCGSAEEGSRWRVVRGRETGSGALKRREGEGKRGAHGGERQLALGWVDVTSRVRAQPAVALRPVATRLHGSRKGYEAGR
jgi:hypothetical protein